MALQPLTPSELALHALIRIRDEMNLQIDALMATVAPPSPKPKTPHVYTRPVGMAPKRKTA